MPRSLPPTTRWEAKCNQLLDEGALDEDLPLEPLNFAYWLHRQGIDPIERFSTDEDMRMLHAVQLYRVRLQELKVQAAKAREHMPIKYRKNTDQRNRFVAKYKRAIQDQYDAGCKELDLVYKREVGRWLYQDQTKPDGDPKYPMDDAMRAIEDGFMREMKGRFTGGYAHALERQRNIKSDRLKSVYDGATRNAAELELGREVARLPQPHALFCWTMASISPPSLSPREAQSETKGGRRRHRLTGGHLRQGRGDGWHLCGRGSRHARRRRRRRGGAVADADATRRGAGRRTRGDR